MSEFTVIYYMYGKNHLIETPKIVRTAEVEKQSKVTFSLLMHGVCNSQSVKDSVWRQVIPFTDCELFPMTENPCLLSAGSVP